MGNSRQILMQYRKLFFAAILLIFSAQFAASQNNTNSPYTRFGYGDITECTATELRGMGGISIANRSLNTINSVNPASYSSVDSLTFMFDLGASARFSRFSDKNNASSTFNGNLDYLTMRFPVTKWLGFSAGMQPFSLVGYNFSQKGSLSIPETNKKIGYQQSFNGSGGISQVYAGLSVNLLNHVSLGANAYYIFGDANHYAIQSFDNTNGFNPSYYNKRIKVNDFKLRYGVQVYNTFADKHNVTLGLIYENKNRLNGEFTATLNNDTINNISGFELPGTFGAGITYTYNKKLTVGFDYVQQGWNDALFFGKTDTLVNTSKYAVGLEYIPNPTSLKYSDLIRYRVGFCTSNQYYKVDNVLQPRNFIVSAGIGFPTRTGKSILNFALEYGKIGSVNRLREDYLKLTFSTSINEFWFFKPKL